MTLQQALSNPYFWGYAASAVGLLLVIWGVLFWYQRKGQRLDDLRRLFWSWVILVGTSVVAVLLGQGAYVFCIALLSLFACKEFARATGLYEDWLFTGLVYLAILAVNGVALWAGADPQPPEQGMNYAYELFMATPIYAVAAFCLLPVLRNRAEGMLQRVALSVMAFVYFGYFLAHLSLFPTIYALVSTPPGEIYGFIFFLIFGSATSDFFGSVVDHNFGRHAIAPRISAEKTWEGALATLLWAAGWCFSLGWTFSKFDPVALLLAAGIFGIMGPLGDLVMRFILRDLGLKTHEEGTALVPYLALNHLNRLIFVAPLFFRLVKLYYGP
jgi:phosphatidate cytidylyltransferase